MSDEITLQVKDADGEILIDQDLLSEGSLAVTMANPGESKAMLWEIEDGEVTRAVIE